MREIADARNIFGLRGASEPEEGAGRGRSPPGRPSPSPASVSSEGVGAGGLASVAGRVDRNDVPGVAGEREAGADVAHRRSAIDLELPEGIAVAGRSGRAVDTDAASVAPQAGQA